MRVYSSMPSEEFIQQLRDAAIKNQMAPLVIDAIDQLRGADDEDPRVAELEEEVNRLENKIQDLIIENSELKENVRSF